MEGLSQPAGTAISPNAYLSALLAFAVEQLRNDGQPVDVAWLSQTFAQPFDQLPASDEAQQRQLLQPIICCEVLRSCTGETGATQDLLFSTYQAMLVAIGTTYDQVRSARTASDEQRQRLADRIGVDTGPRPDPLDQLFVPPEQLSETVLASLFGLANTAADPFQPLPIPQLQSWQEAHLQTLWYGERYDVTPVTPLIDPDLIGSDYLAHPQDSDPAYHLWTTRRSAIDAELAALDAQRRQAPDPLSGFAAIVSSALEVAVSALTDLAGRRAQGYDVEAQITALGLTVAGFDALTHAQAVLEQKLVLLDGEWEDLISILTGAWKRKQFPTWVAQEQSLKLVLSAGEFTVPTSDPAVFPPPPPAPLPLWRVSVDELLEWQATLRAHLDQATQVRSSLQVNATAADASTLPALRSWLLGKLKVPAGITDRSAWFSWNYLIDAQLSGTQLSTRTGQAMQTMQGILWAVRTRALITTHPALTLVSEDVFDTAWGWIGSYSTWVPAVLVTIYPENYLSPGLRPWSSPAFSALVGATNDSIHLTPTQARLAAQDYATYFRDLNNLAVEAMCQAETCVGPVGDPSGPTRVLTYLFARGTLTRTLYVSVVDEQDPSGYQQTPWTAVPGLTDCSAIVGAVPWRGGAQLGAICLFAILAGSTGDRLVLSRYDLLARGWTSAPAELPVPSHATSFTATIQQSNARVTTTLPPGLVLLIAGQPPFLARLTSAGTALDLHGWTAIASPGNFPASRALRALMWEADGTTWRAVSETPNGSLAISGSDLASPVIADAEFCGVLNYQTITAFVLYRSKAQLDKVRYTTWKTPGQPVELTLAQTAAGIATTWMAGDPTDTLPMFFSGPQGAFRSLVTYQIPLLSPATATRTAPKVAGPFLITDRLDSEELKAHTAAVIKDFIDNAGGDPSICEYLREAYYFVPIQLALRLGASDQYITALDWMRTVWDFTAPVLSIPVVAGASPSQQAQAWLADPLHAARLADTKAEALGRYTMITVAELLLRYADSEFGRDTPESVPRATVLYQEADRVLAVLRMPLPPVPPLSGAAWQRRPTHGQMVARAAPVRATWLDTVASLRPAATLAGPGLLGSPDYAMPPNPTVESLSQHSALNLYKLRGGRNIAGMQRQLDPYAMPTVAGTGYPVIGVGGELQVPAQGFAPPTGYRSSALIARAKQLSQMASQIESTMLAALERKDAEYYTLLRARQDLGLAQAGVVLQDLRVQESTDSVVVAQLGQERAQLQVSYYDTQLANGWSSYEQASLALMYTSAGLQAAAGATNFIAAALPSSVGSGFPEIAQVSVSPQGSAMAMASGMSSFAGAASTTASALSTIASFERRESEWRFQRSLAEQDAGLSSQQITVAQDQVRISGQERNIAAMQSANAASTVEYLASKFTNVALYEWMSRVLEGVYRFFLQQATGVAQTAARQLAFERQEQPPAVIQADYWDAPGTSGGVGDSGSRGLTGSARLLQDVVRLEQYAFDTERTKLQLSKTVSLMRLSPAEFQGLREKGVMTFATPMELFDRDFPGQYLRLVRRVRVSVIALIPAVDSIKATLTAAGQSRVVVADNDVFRTLAINQAPALISLSSPRDASGQFDLLPSDPERIAPFEGMGVDTVWRFALPPAANRFDFTSIADVLLTIDYTALFDDTYRSQVVRSLSPWLSSDRPLSFRQELADQWYELCNPAQSQTPLQVSFTTTTNDFPPNLAGLAIEAVLLAVARSDGQQVEVDIAALDFTPCGGSTVGGGATTIGGVVSTRRGNGSAWLPMLGKPVIGLWTLAFADTPAMRELFSSGAISDLMLVISYRGRTPPWPG